MTSHSSSGLGIYLVAHRRLRPKPPADGILKYKKKKEKGKRKEKKTPQTPTTYPRQNGSGRAPAFASILSPNRESSLRIRARGVVDGWPRDERLNLAEPKN